MRVRWNDPGIVNSALDMGAACVIAPMTNSVEQVKALGGVRAVVTPGMIWEHLDFNLDNALFKDARVRRAVALAIDRQALAGAVLKGAASPAAGDQSPLSWAYNPAVAPPARDAAGARELLLQAGWKAGPDGIFAKDGRRLAFDLAVTGAGHMLVGLSGHCRAALWHGTALSVTLSEAHIAPQGGKSGPNGEENGPNGLTLRQVGRQEPLPQSLPRPRRHRASPQGSGREAPGSAVRAGPAAP